MHTSSNKSTESYENIGVKLHVVRHVPVLNELAAKKKEIQAFLTLSDILDVKYTTLYTILHP